MSKNIISGAPLSKNIINAANDSGSKVVVNSDKSDVVQSKVMTTDSLGSFMKNAPSKNVISKVVPKSKPTVKFKFYKGIFNVDKNITSIFNNVGIKTDGQIPKNKKELIKIKGIGTKTAEKILKQLKKRKIK